MAGERITDVPRAIDTFPERKYPQDYTAKARERMKSKMSDPGSRYLRRRSKRSLDDLNHLRTFFDRPNLPRSAGDRCFGGPTIEIEPDRSLSLLSDQPGKVMVQQSMLGFVVALQLCSAIEQQNVITLENILRIRSRTKRKYANKKKVFVIF